MKNVFLVFDSEYQKAQWTRRLKSAIIACIKQHRAKEAAVASYAEQVYVLISNSFVACASDPLGFCIHRLNIQNQSSYGGSKSQQPV